MAHHAEFPTPNQMLMYTSTWPAPEHVRRQKGPEPLQAAGATPRSKERVIGTQYTVVRRRDTLTSSGSEVLEFVSVTYTLTC